MTANFCWKLRGRALLITHCVPDIGLDALMYINHLRHTHSVGYVVASHFKGEKTETKQVNLAKVTQLIKTEELRLKSIQGCGIPFHSVVQVIMASESKRVCSSEQGAPWR